MTPKQIIEKYLQTHSSELSADQLLESVFALKNQKNAFAAQERDCLFVVKLAVPIAHVAVMIGGSGKDFIKAAKKLVQELRSAGIQYIQCGVNDPNLWKKIALATGGKGATFSTSPNGEKDPYVMSMEI